MSLNFVYYQCGVNNNKKQIKEVKNEEEVR